MGIGTDKLLIQIRACILWKWLERGEDKEKREVVGLGKRLLSLPTDADGISWNRGGSQRRNRPQPWQRNLQASRARQRLQGEVPPLFSMPRLGLLLYPSKTAV